MSAALVVIDVQKAFHETDVTGAARSCPEAAENIAKLLEHFRSQDVPVIHVHHHADDPDDPFFSDGPGAAPEEFAKPIGDEPTIVKKTSSAFVGTGLDEMLRLKGVSELTLCGAAANYCVDSTARSAGDLGYSVQVVGDAVWTYGEAGPDGVGYEGQTLHAVSMANLHGEFATVVSTRDVLDR